MRGRISFALTALTLLFLLQGLNTVLATSFATFTAALYPTLRPLALLPLVVPLLALLAPVVPITRVIPRREAIAAAAMVAATARVPMSLPQHEVRLITAALVVAAGAVFLSMAVGFVERRSVAGGVATAVVIDQLMRLGGWSWDITLRAWWVLPQLIASAAVILLARAWLRQPLPGPADADSSYERRAGGLRLRGGIALGLLLFIDLNVLARPEVATRWLGVPYQGAAVLLVVAGLAATLVLLAGHGPVGQNRPAALSMALLTGFAVVASRPTGGWAGVGLMAAGHGAAVLLLGRTLVPATGRRKGSTAAMALAIFVGLTLLYAGTFFPSFTFAALDGAAPWIFGGAALLLAAVLMLLPKPLETHPPMQGRLYVALTVLLVLGAAALLALRDRPDGVLDPPADALTVATWNVRHGFDTDWTFDPARIADEIRVAGSTVVALQEVGGLPLAYGADLPHYIARKLGMRVHFSPTQNGLAGDAVLTAGRPVGVRTVALPGSAVLGMVRMPLQRDSVPVYTTRLSTDPTMRVAQVDSILRVIANESRVVLAGDLNAEAGDPAIVRLRAAGFRDVFELAGVTAAPTAPADAPARRIDWIMARGLEAAAASVLPTRAADHRLVRADLRVPVRR